MLLVASDFVRYLATASPPLTAESCKDSWDTTALSMDNVDRSRGFCRPVSTSVICVSQAHNCDRMP